MLRRLRNSVTMTSRHGQLGTERDSIGGGTFRKKGSTIKNWKIRNYEIYDNGCLHYFDTNTLIHTPSNSKGFVDCNYGMISDGDPMNCEDSGLNNGIPINILSTSSSKPLEIVFSTVEEAAEFIVFLYKVAIGINAYTYLSNKANDSSTGKLSDYIKGSGSHVLTALSALRPSYLNTSHVSENVNDDEQNIEESETIVNHSFVSNYQNDDNLEHNPSIAGSRYEPSIQFEHIYEPEERASNVMSQNSPFQAPSTTSKLFQNIEDSSERLSMTSDISSGHEVTKSVTSHELLKIEEQSIIADIVRDPQRVLACVWLIIVSYSVSSMNVFGFGVFIAGTYGIVKGMRHYHNKSLEQS